MPYRGPDFYDDEAVFATFIKHRAWPDNPNDTIAQPILREMVGDLAGLRVLDLGCGAGGFGVHALAVGARSYLGVDGAHAMTEAARALIVHPAGSVVTGDLEQWTPPQAAFDLAVSSLTLHYLADLDSLLSRIARGLIPGGRIVFSVEHPVITSCDQASSDGRRQAWLVDDYFDIGPRETTWMGGRIIKHHRTVETYFVAMQNAGFVVDALRESHPRPHLFADSAEYVRRLRIPLFLFLAGRTPSSTS